MTHRARLLAAAALLCLPLGAAAQPTGASGPKPVTVAVIEDRTGPLEAYARQDVAGLRLGIEYATRGTNAVAGRPIRLVEKDSQTKPDVGRDLLAEAFNDEDADLAIGGTSSAVALAMLPVAADSRKVLIVDAAVADSITGERWNRYVFRVDRNSSQDAIANALAVGKPGTVVATLAQDYAFGRDGVRAFRAALLATGARLVHEEYVPPATTDFTAPAQRIFDALGRETGPRILFVIWAGADPMSKLAALDPGRLGIALSTGGNILPVLKAWNAYPSLNGMAGATYYYHDIPRNPANDWLVAEHTKRFGGPPDFFTAVGMSTGIALVAALEKTGGDPAAEKLIAAMEGMDFDSPKGRMQFRAADHQALQPMYGFTLRVDPAAPNAVPVLTREFGIGDMDVPVTNKR